MKPLPNDAAIRARPRAPTLRRYRTVPALAALAMFPGPEPADAQVLSRESEIIFQVSSAPAVRPDAGTVSVLENGERRQVLAVDPVADRWRIVIYFDLPASTPEGVEAAATALGEVAERLVGLGDVEVVTSDRIVEVVLEPTRDAGELRQAAAEVAGRAHEAGGLLALRREMKAAAASRSGDPNADGLRTADLLEGFLQELDTLGRQRSSLLESLRTTSWTRGPPRALFLVRDGMDLNADAFAQRLLGGPTPAFERTAVSEQHQQRSLARAVAALGWRVYPLHAAPATAEIADLFPGHRLHSEEFARTSGGRLLTTADELTTALERLPGDGGGGVHTAWQTSATAPRHRATPCVSRSTAGVSTRLHSRFTGPARAPISTAGPGGSERC